MPKILHNPFTNRGRIEKEDQSIGRRVEINNILSRVRNGDSVSIVGDRRIGKSSLLYHLFLTGNTRLDDEEKSKYKFIYLDLHDPQLKSVSAFCQKVCTKLGKQSIFTGSSADPLEELSYLSRVLDEMKEKGVLPVLLMDEFEAFLGKQKRFDDDFFEALRFYANSHQLAFVTSSQNTLRELTTKEGLTSPLWNIFTLQELGEFVVDDTRNEVTEFLTRFWTGDLQPTEDEQSFLISYCSRHPLIMQVVSCWVLKNRELKYNEAALKEKIDKELTSYFIGKDETIKNWLKKTPKFLERIEWTTDKIGKVVKNLNPFSVNINIGK